MMWTAVRNALAAAPPITTASLHPIRSFGAF